MYHIENEAHVGVRWVAYRNINIGGHTVQFRKTNSFMYCLQGGLDFDFGTYKLSLRPGEMIYLPYGSAYTNTTTGVPTEFYQIQFSVFDGNEPVALRDRACITESYESDRYLALISEAYENYIRNNNSRSLCMGNLLKMIGYFEAEDSNGVNHKALSAVSPALTHIERHYNLDTTVEELADMCSLSISALEKNFKKVFGITPAKYRNNVRTEHAKQLLSGGYSTEETANITGFSDRYYFSKIFKKLTGMSPREYQESNVHV